MSRLYRIFTAINATSICVIGKDGEFKGLLTRRILLNYLHKHEHHHHNPPNHTPAIVATDEGPGENATLMDQMVKLQQDHDELNQSLMRAEKAREAIKRELSDAKQEVLLSHQESSKLQQKLEDL